MAVGPFWIIVPTLRGATRRPLGPRERDELRRLLAEVARDRLDAASEERLRDLLERQGYAVAQLPHKDLVQIGREHLAAAASADRH